MIKRTNKVDEQLRQRIWIEMDKIGKAVERLEELGDIACNLCGDVGCASSVISNQLFTSQLRIYKLLGGKIARVTSQKKLFSDRNRSQ